MTETLKKTVCFGTAACKLIKEEDPTIELPTQWMSLLNQMRLQVSRFEQKDNSSQLLCNFIWQQIEIQKLQATLIQQIESKLMEVFGDRSEWYPLLEDYIIKLDLSSSL